MFAYFQLFLWLVLRIARITSYFLNINDQTNFVVFDIDPFSSLKVIWYQEAVIVVT